MFAEVNGQKLYYEVTGEGRPLLLVHGNGEDHTIFNEAAAILKEQYTCYSLDSRGHGQSSPVSEYHYREMAEDLLAFLETEDLRDVIFYGFSDGGILGLMLAAETDRITDLIVSGANLDPQGVKPSIGRVIKLLNRLKPDPRVTMMLKEPDITTEELGRIKARTLVLAGSRDLIRREHTQKIADGIPGSRLRIVRGEGHGSYIVHSTKIAVLLGKWLKQKKS